MSNERDRDWRGRTQNSDGGRWYDRGDVRDPRGMGDRAKDEVRSWFGDEEAERRRERDARADEAQEPHRDRAPDGNERDDQPWGDGGFDNDRSYGTRRSFGQAGYGTGGRDDRFAAHHDEAYRNWRDQHIASLDREYEEYRRERQQQFESDFDSFRRGRQGQGSGGNVSLGQGGSNAAGTSGISGNAAAATTSGGGTASAATSSTGSSNDGWGVGQPSGGGESGSGAGLTGAQESGAGPASDAGAQDAGSSR